MSLSELYLLCPELMTTYISGISDCTCEIFTGYIVIVHIWHSKLRMKQFIGEIQQRLREIT